MPWVLFRPPNRMAFIDCSCMAARAAVGIDRNCAPSNFRGHLVRLAAPLSSGSSGRSFRTPSEEKLRSVPLNWFCGLEVLAYLGLGWSVQRTKTREEKSVGDHVPAGSGDRVRGRTALRRPRRPRQRFGGLRPHGLAHGGPRRLRRLKGAPPHSQASMFPRTRQRHLPPLVP